MIINQGKRSVLRLSPSLSMIESINTLSSYQRINGSNKLLNSNAFQYVKIKDLNEIKETYKQKGFLKILSKSCGFFMKQAWQDFKTDYQIFKQIKSLPQEFRSPQQKDQYRKIKVDMIKFGPAFAIFNVPFGFPLFYFYLTLFPQLIPSWMMVDSIHQKTVQSRQKRKAQAWQYYTSKFDQDLRLAYLKEAIFKQNQSLEDLRRISCLCYNDYIDGTEYLSSKLGFKFSNGLVLPKLSIFILKVYLKNQLKHDYQIENELKGFHSFEEKLFFKLQRQIHNNFQ